MLCFVLGVLGVWKMVVMRFELMGVCFMVRREFL